MQNSSQQFFIKLILFSAIVFGVLYLLQYMQVSYFKTRWYWLICLFFMITTATIHVVLMNMAAQSPQKFVRAFMGLTAVKLFGYASIITVYALLRKQAALGFALTFLVAYFLFSAFEVVVLYKQLRKK